MTELNIRRADSLTPEEQAASQEAFRNIEVRVHDPDMQPEEVEYYAALAALVVGTGADKAVRIDDPQQAIEAVHGKVET